MGLLSDQPSTLFREASAMIAFELEPTLLDGVEDRVSGGTVDARQHPPPSGLSIGCFMDHPHNMLG